MKKLLLIFGLLSLATANVYAQTVRGTVTNAQSGNTLPGVNILVKGTTTGTSTDSEGSFELTVPSLQDTLVVSYIGYQTQEVPIDGQTELDVTLLSQTIEGEEMVVVGYGEQQKRNLTGTVSSVSADELNSGNVTNPIEMLQGKVAGANITLNSGRPGANSSIRIRGASSITASNAPLYVIDGIPVSFNESNFSTVSYRQAGRSRDALNMLNTDAIKSIEVLKDASATAIYGSRAANGVVLITTKKGSKGQSRLSYNGSVTISKIRKKLDMLNAEEFRNYVNSNSEITNWESRNSSTDWQDQIFRTGISQSHSLNLGGGNSKTSYFTSISYSNNEGILIKSGLQKLTGNVRVDHTDSFLGNEVDLNLNFKGAQVNSNNTPNPSQTGSNTGGGLLRDALHQDPTWPVKNKDGSYTFRSVLNQNPVEVANTIIDKTNNFRQIGNIAVDYNLTDFMSSRTKLGFTKEDVNRNFYLPINSRLGRSSHGTATRQSRKSNSKLLETELRFNNDFSVKHHAQGFVGYSYQQFVYSGDFIQGTNFISDATTFNNIGGARNQPPVQSYKRSNKLISFYGRIRYNYDDKYLLTLTGRRDGSSRFGENNKWGWFPSAAVAWHITEEKFLKDDSILSDLKLRFSYGITGNQEIGDYNSLETLSAGNNLYIIGGEGLPAVGPNQIANPNLKWERTAQTNIGIDFGFLHQRISGALNLYKKVTRDLLLSFKVPSPTIVSSTIANVGSINNKGIELDLNGILLNSDSFQWDFNMNISHNKQKVISLSNDNWSTSEIHTGSFKAPGFSNQSPKIIKPGEPLGSFYGFKYLGTNDDGEQQFLDVNGDGEILPGDDKVIIGNDQPNFVYGFGSELNYKRFRFDFFFRGVLGNDIFNGTATDTENLSQLPGYNVSKDAITNGVAYDQSLKYSSKWLEDGSYLRLQNITLDYSVNVNSIEGLSQANVYIKSKNLFVLTKYSGYDPEVPNGVDYMQYPHPRSLVFGVNLQF